jgi:hypothetical protein
MFFLVANDIKLDCTGWLLFFDFLELKKLNKGPNIFSYLDSTHLKTYPQKFSSKTPNVYIKNVEKNLGSIYIRPTLYAYECSSYQQNKTC